MEYMSIFEKQELAKPDFFQRLFGITPKINGVIAIRNLFASRAPKEVSVEDIQTIARDFKLNIHRNYRDHFLDIYRRYLLHCLEDRSLSTEEIETLKHIKFVLRLDDTDVKRIRGEVAENVYKEELENALADGRIDEDERKFLNRIGEDLQLKDEFVKDIFQKKAGERIKEHLDSVVASGRLSPENEKELEALTSNLGIELNITDKDQAHLDKFKLYWQIENGELPVLDAPVRLFRGESCHFMTPCNWLEMVTETRRINYGGPTLRLKIAKGVYWRAGSLGVNRVSKDVWRTIDSGRLFLTNKRIIFMGSRRNRVIRLNTILDFTAYRNGVDIQKARGKSPFLEFSADTGIFSLILGRVIDESIAG